MKRIKSQTATSSVDASQSSGEPDPGDIATLTGVTSNGLPRRKEAVTKRKGFRPSVVGIDVADGDGTGQKGYLLKKGSGLAGKWQKRYFTASEKVR